MILDATNVGIEKIRHHQNSMPLLITHQITTAAPNNMKNENEMLAEQNGEQEGEGERVSTKSNTWQQKKKKGFRMCQRQTRKRNTRSLILGLSASTSLRIHSAFIPFTYLVYAGNNQNQNPTPFIFILVCSASQRRPIHSSRPSYVISRNIKMIKYFFGT